MVSTRISPGDQLTEGFLVGPDKMALGSGFPRVETSFAELSTMCNWPSSIQVMEGNGVAGK